MKIIVLAGGTSTERDVSLITGTGVYTALRSKGHQVILLDVFLGYEKEDLDLSEAFDHPEKINAVASGIKETAPDLEEIKKMRTDGGKSFFGPNVIELCQMADIVFLALHGENGENGKIQAAFDLLGIKYTGTGYLSSAIAMNKGLSKRLFEEAGIPMPKGIAYKKDSEIELEKEIGFPCVVKPCCGGSSIGVSIAHDVEELQKALKDAFAYEEEIIVEQYIKGREFSVSVVDQEALPIIEIAPISGFYDYKNKYQAGSTIETCPAELPDSVTKEMQENAVKVCAALGLEGYSRMDFLMDEENRIYCLEANTLPGMTPTSLIPQEAKAIGISYEDLCEKLIEVSLKKYHSMNGQTFLF